MFFQRIVVVGDVMLDHYLFGSMETSREPPGVKLRIEKENYRLGGAANVAHNLSTLGAKVVLVGVVGRSHQAEIEELLKGSSIESALVFDKERQTTIKRRYVASGVVELRADLESTEETSPVVTAALCQNIKRHSKAAHALIVSDYQKGAIGRETFQAVIQAGKAQGTPTFVDPKFRTASFYSGVTVLKLNEKEAAALVEKPLLTNADIEWAGMALLRETRAKAVLLTLGKRGMKLFERGRKPVAIQTRAQEVFDVVGAGDTVTAVCALMRTCKASYIESAHVANVAAGLVVGKAGTATVSREELLQALSS